MIELFIAGLSEQSANTLDNAMLFKKAPRGSILLGEGTNARDLHFIYEGGVDIFQRMEHSGQVMALRVASLTNMPVLLGEANMFLGRQRNASVVASEDVKYAILPYGKLLELKTNHPELYITLIEYCSETMAKRVLDAQENLQHRILKQTDTPGKAFALLRLINKSVKVCPPALAKKLFGGAKFFSV